MKNAKKIKFNKKPLIASLAVLSIVATGLPLVKATIVNASDYTQEDIDYINSFSHATEEYHKNFDYTQNWDGKQVTPEQAAWIDSHIIYGRPSSVDPFAPKQPENDSPSTKIYKLNGAIIVNNRSDSFVSLYSFSADGRIGNVKNRALANKTDWYSDKYRQYNGHDYYRVATNEWVKDSDITGYVPK